MKRLWMVISLCLVMCKATAADENTQTNTSGSNTNITGGYESTTENTYSGAHTETTTNDTTSTSTTSNKSGIPVGTASAPSFSAYSQDLCVAGVSGGFQTMDIGISMGKHYRDENCERIKLSKVLHDFGMKVASVSLLCQDHRVFIAMNEAGTPCPFEGKIGNEAKQQWEKYGKLRPDYKHYTSRLKEIETVNKIVIAETKTKKKNKEKAKLKNYKKKLQEVDKKQKLREKELELTRLKLDREIDEMNNRKKSVDELHNERLRQTNQRIKNQNETIIVDEDNQSTVVPTQEIDEQVKEISTHNYNPPIGW